MAGNAVLGAAKSALEKWHTEERPAIAEYTHLTPKTTPFDEETGYATPNFCYAYAAEAAEVEVDLDTGSVQVLKIVAASDVGRAINPKMVEGQIEGAVVQAQGYALMENFQMQGGKVLTDSMANYLIPTIMDIPGKIDSLILELPDPNSPLGARGVGEPPYLPLAPALMAAIHDAVGIWIDKLPASSEKVIKELKRSR